MPEAYVRFYIQWALTRYERYEVMRCGKNSSTSVTARKLVSYSKKKDVKLLSLGVWPPIRRNLNPFAPYVLFICSKNSKYKPWNI